MMMCFFMVMLQHILLIGSNIGVKYRAWRIGFVFFIFINRLLTNMKAFNEWSKQYHKFHEYSGIIGQPCLIWQTTYVDTFNNEP